MPSCLVFLDGPFRLTEALRQRADGARLIAADAGALRMARVGLTPQLCIGDFDGAPPPTGIPQRAFAADKDLTDGELAVAEAVREGADDVLIVGAFAGRYDMALSHLALLRRARAAGARASLTDGRTEALLASRGPSAAGPVGARVSVLPLTPSARLSSTGLRWPLDGPPFLWDRARGISNEVVAPGATIRLIAGQALIVRRLLPPRKA